MAPNTWDSRLLMGFVGVVPPWSEDGRMKPEKKEPVSKDKQ
jgi:hypothetical protein